LGILITTNGEGGFCDSTINNLTHLKALSAEPLINISRLKKAASQLASYAICIELEQPFCQCLTITKCGAQPSREMREACCKASNRRHGTLVHDKNPQYHERRFVSSGNTFVTLPVWQANEQKLMKTGVPALPRRRAIRSYKIPRLMRQTTLVVRTPAWKSYN